MEIQETYRAITPLTAALTKLQPIPLTKSLWVDIVSIPNSLGHGDREREWKYGYIPDVKAIENILQWLGRT